MASKIITGAFTSTASAKAALNELYQRQVRQEAISVILPEGARDEFARLEENTKAPEGAAVGGVAGVAIGGLAAGLSTVALIPGVGILAAGPILAMLAGAGAGGLFGGALGSLIGLGLTEHEAKLHTDILKRGGMIVLVSTSDPMEQNVAKEIFQRRAAKLETERAQSAHL
ncbi:MAG: DUF3341 domain-containing protein [Myxococcales bacterium]|nr:DUF3341 domain-containing protein [Myxococcales bacterium]